MARKIEDLFDPEVLVRMARSPVALLEYRAEANIFLQGARADAIYYIREGKVKYTVASHQGKRAVLGIYKSGEFFGVGCIAGRPIRIATATAITTCSLIRIHKKAMPRLLQGQRKFSEFFVADLLASILRFQEELIACSSDPGTVRTGGTSTIRSNASSPDNRRLSYSYSASAGNVSGNNANATLNTAGASPGPIRVTCTVSDDRSPALTASATTTVTVEAPPPPPPPPPPPAQPQPTALELRLALHSIYFQTARPTVSDPTGGLLDSQQQILTTLASDFKEYLRTRPEAHLTLEAHADPRGSAQYNQILTERRVDRTKNFLIGQGVPAANLEVKSFGYGQNLTDDEVKQAVQQNPDLSEADRQRMLRNMSAIILASNRRVDVVLSTTGQQSLRQYPFNARDFLALISTQGEGTRKGTTTKGTTTKGTTKKQ